MGKRITIFHRFCIGYAAVSIGLFLYSYTQVDLSLTITRNTFWHQIQSYFQNIGYYQRPVSTGIFVFIIAAFFILYGLILRAVLHNRLSRTEIWRLILIVSGLLVLSYPAFSYDFFNYMFTAKTVLVYQKNPYLLKPIELSGLDPYLSFIRWTHLPSAYTPVWILISLIPYYLGFGYFLIIMWNFKLLFVASYILASWIIGEILRNVSRKQELIGIVIFALNPLVIIESLVSSHNDIVMMTLAVLAYLFYLRHRQLWSLFTLSISVAIKMITIMLIPVIVKKWDRWWLLAAMTVGLTMGFIKKELLPWYFLWVIPFISLVPYSPDLIIIASGLSAGLLLRYAPYLYFGSYDDPVNRLRDTVTIFCLVISLSAVAVRHLRLKSADKNKIS